MKLLTLCALAILSALAESYSAANVNKLARKSAYRRGLVNCYGLDGEHYHSLSHFSGVTIQHYDSTIGVTVVVEFCFSVSVIMGEYSTATKKLVGGGEAYNGHNHGYYLTTLGDSTGTYSLRSNYSSGDDAYPCATKPNREAILGIQCVSDGRTCASGSCTVDQSTGYCVCGIQASGDCGYTIELLMQCTANSEPNGQATFHLAWLVGFLCLVCFGAAVSSLRLKTRLKLAKAYLESSSQLTDKKGLSDVQLTRGSPSTSAGLHQQAMMLRQVLSEKLSSSADDVISPPPVNYEFR